MLIYKGIYYLVALAFLEIIEAKIVSMKKDFNFYFNYLFGDKNTYRGESFSPELKHLLYELWVSMEGNPKKVKKVENSVENIIKFMNSEEGNTDVNCRVVDIFVCGAIQEEYDYSDLPLKLQEILDDMGGSLHDTHSSPEIARKMESLPSQLFERIRNLKHTKDVRP